MIGFAGRSIIASICFGFGLLLAGPATAAMGVGDIGEPCLADGTCSNGVCVGGAGGFCAPCGMPGEAACPGANPSEPDWCHLDGWGYQPAASAGGSVCINPASADCGQVGALACDRDNRPFCYYGVALGSRLGTVCIACGGIGEACCAGDRVCDTGSCQAGICRVDPPKPADPAKAIEKAIIACEFDAARQGIAALDANDPARQSLSRWLEDAVAIEAQVDQMVDWAKQEAQSAKDLVAKGDLMTAMLNYRYAKTRLEQARDLTRCPGEADKLDTIALSALITAEQAMEAMIVDQFARNMAICDFKNAEGYLDWGKQSGVGKTDLMAKRLEEARTAERQARDAYSKGAAANRQGNDLMNAKDFAGALAAYKTARTELDHARQLTVCQVTRDGIAASILDIGENEVAAQAGAAMVKPGAQPAKGIDPTPPGPHPCLDRAVESDATVAQYTQGMGGGGSMPMKGPYLCDKRYVGSKFEVFDGSTATAYACDQDGGRYVNCRVLHIDTITEVKAHGDGTDYFYSCGNNLCYLTITPKRSD